MCFRACLRMVWRKMREFVCFFVKSEMFGGERGEIFGKCKNNVHF